MNVVDQMNVPNAEDNLTLAVLEIYAQSFKQFLVALVLVVLIICSAFVCMEHKEHKCM